jgi:hypothetical protein
VVTAAVVAAVLSGAPSTVHALITGGSPLAAARAAGALLGRPSLGRGLVAHGAISLGWAAVLARVLPRRHTAAWGALGGLGIAGLDLGIAVRVRGRRLQPVADLPILPQVADHAAFGAVVGATLARLSSPPCCA